MCVCVCVCVCGAGSKAGRTMKRYTAFVRAARLRGLRRRRQTETGLQASFRYIQHTCAACGAVNECTGSRACAGGRTRPALQRPAPASGGGCACACACVHVCVICIRERERRA